MKLVILLLCINIMNQEKSSTLFDFTNEKKISQWNVVNDGVMGGLSEGEMLLNAQGNALFRGYVSTENNGGFSSVRYEFDQKDVTKFKQVALKVKGDGKSYQFRMKSEISQRYSYIKTFKTSGEWETIKIPLSSFYASFRGNTLDKPNYPGKIMEEIALLIGNKRNESFSLEISKIYLE